MGYKACDFKNLRVGVQMAGQIRPSDLFLNRESLRRLSFGELWRPLYAALSPATWPVYVTTEDAISNKGPVVG